MVLMTICWIPNRVPYWKKSEQFSLFIGWLQMRSCPWRHIRTIALLFLSIFYKTLVSSVYKEFFCTPQINKVVRKNLITVLSKSFLVHQSWIVFLAFTTTEEKISGKKAFVTKGKNKSIFVSLINWWNFIFDSDWQGVIEWQVEFEFYLPKVHILFSNCKNTKNCF